ncbi:hypothetical protein DFH09DRAFT_1424051 [Mycena vulgaris]|nr:hypothetical protein DFH09DRAFT_1424051 [Mycena vulgaris]
MCVFWHQFGHAKTETGTEMRGAEDEYSRRRQWKSEGQGGTDSDGKRTVGSALMANVNEQHMPQSSKVKQRERRTHESGLRGLHRNAVEMMKKRVMRHAAQKRQPSRTVDNSSGRHAIESGRAGEMRREWTAHAIIQQSSYPTQWHPEGYIRMYTASGAMDNSFEVETKGCMPMIANGESSLERRRRKTRSKQPCCGGKKDAVWLCRSTDQTSLASRLHHLFSVARL